tara:strand:- start:566 stop:715 length:150 start_codon:yes stop_codon:yes gene_type:complete
MKAIFGSLAVLLLVTNTQAISLDSMYKADDGDDLLEGLIAGKHCKKAEE